MRLWEACMRFELARMDSGKDSDKEGAARRLKRFAETGNCAGMRCRRCPFEPACAEGMLTDGRKAELLCEEVG